jgi:hypothetical protein
MTRLILGIVLSAFSVAAALQGSVGEVGAAENWRCRQVYDSVHPACVKRNGQAQCDRVIGGRLAVCMKTGCWKGGPRNSRCGYTRL